MVRGGEAGEDERLVGSEFARVEVDVGPLAIGQFTRVRLFERVADRDRDRVRAPIPKLRKNLPVPSGEAIVFDGVKWGSRQTIPAGR